jgi:hypothetical protein
MTDLYVEQHAGLVTVHRALLQQLAVIAAGSNTPLDVLLPQARTAAGFLLGHHEMESRALFPGLREHGRLRSTDLAFLDHRDREHQEIHKLCDALLTTANALHPHSATLARDARELLDIFEPHTREEEEGLAPDRLRTMIDPAGLAALGRALEAAREAALARLAAAERNPIHR